MSQIYTALIQQQEGWWIGWIAEIPGVNCQERTKEELIDTLRITLVEALEFNIIPPFPRGASGRSTHRPVRRPA